MALSGWGGGVWCGSSECWAGEEVVWQGCEGVCEIVRCGCCHIRGVAFLLFWCCCTCAVCGIWLLASRLSQVLCRITAAEVDVYNSHNILPTATLLSLRLLAADSRLYRVCRWTNTSRCDAQ